MKKKLKQDKGITLVALIITIILLVILSAIVIRVLVDDKLITLAGNAAQKYKEAEEKELKELDKIRRTFKRRLRVYKWENSIW